MGAVSIKDRSDWASVQIIDAAARERKTFSGEIVDRRREIEMAGKPRLHRVMIGRDHIDKVIGLQ